MFLALLRTVVTDEPFTAVPTKDDWEVLWIEIRFWTRFLELIPARIRYRTLSLNNIER